MRIELREMPGWPVTLSFDEALACSGLAASFIRKGVRDRALSFEPPGFNGRKIVLRDQLDEYLRRLFAGPIRP